MPEARYCDQCGESLVPLPSFHVQRTCQDCGRTVHVAEPGEGGKGIRVKKGDKFVIPAGAISLSLDLKTGGRLSQHGVRWFVRHLVMEPLNRPAEEIDGLLKYWEDEGEAILRGSETFSHLDLDDEDDQLASIDLAKGNPDSLELWAWQLVVHTGRCSEHLENGNTAEAILEASKAQAAHFLVTYLRDLDEYVWIGYRHSQLIYGIAKATAHTPAEAEAIESLRPTFESLSEEVLHAWVNSNADIGPRIGIAEIDEGLLHALAEYHLSEFERRRSQQQLDREHGSRRWTNSAALVGAGAAAASAVLGILRVIGLV